MVPNGPGQAITALGAPDRSASRRRSWPGTGCMPDPCASARRESPGPSSWPRSWPSRPRSRASTRPGPASWRASPRLGHLAEASPADVLRAWSGLGYNRRALNLQRAARVIVAAHGGRVPDDVAELEALPGVGAVHVARRGGAGLRASRGCRGHERPARHQPAHRSRPRAAASCRRSPTSWSPTRTRRPGPTPRWSSAPRSAGRGARTAMPVRSAAGAPASVVPVSTAPCRCRSRDAAVRAHDALAARPHRGPAAGRRGGRLDAAARMPWAATVRTASRWPWRPSSATASWSSVPTVRSAYRRGRHERRTARGVPAERRRASRGAAVEPQRLSPTPPRDSRCPPSTRSSSRPA